MRSLRKKCPYSELLWSVFTRIRTEYRETRSISPYSVRMWENTDQNNSEYGHFSRSDLHSVLLSPVSFPLENTYGKYVIYDEIYQDSQNTSLHERCPNTEFFLVHIFLYSVRIQEYAYQKKLRIWTLLTQCLYI